MRTYALEDGEIIYKSYVNKYTSISHIVYNHDTWIYIIYAYIVRYFNLNYYLNYYRKIDTYRDAFLHTNATNMFVYINHGKLKYAIKSFDIVIDEPKETALPEAFLAMIDGCYCVTDEYNALRNYLSGELGYVAINLILTYKYKREIPMHEFLHMKDMTIMRKDTLNEMTFKKYVRM